MRDAKENNSKKRKTPEPSCFVLNLKKMARSEEKIESENDDGREKKRETIKILNRILKRKIKFFFSASAEVLRTAKNAPKNFIKNSARLSEERALTPKEKMRPIFSFAIILLLLILPFKAFTYYKSISRLNDLRGKVLGVSEKAAGDLLSAGKLANEMKFAEARENFSRASEKFSKAREELNSVNDFLFKLAAIAPDKNLRLAAQSKKALLAAESASKLGENLTLAMAAGAGKGLKDAGGAIKDFAKYGENALIAAENLNASLNEINPKDIPENFKNDFERAKEMSEFLRQSLEEFTDLARAALLFMADGDFKRYLVVFQNNAEMRASGGFIGSYALVDFSDGKIKNIEIPEGGSYDTEGGLKEAIAAPEPLRLVNSRWYFWDANWWPDWPTSAKKLEWFYEKSGGPTVDGVIALTPTVMEKILAVIGPVDMTKEYGIVVTADNFWQSTKEIIKKENSSVSKDSSAAARAEARPKKIIGDLARKIIGELPARMNKKSLARLAAAMEESLTQKQILFYFNDEKLQKAAEKYGWAGKMKHTGRDYLSVVNTNIAGGKSDRKIKENISLEARVGEDGKIVNTLKIRRTHFGKRGEVFFGVRNVDWMRIYVPLGSRLIAAGGFKKPDDIYFERPDENWALDLDVQKTEGGARIDEASGTKIYEEAGKTVFANWLMVDPGETAVVYLRYELPFRFEKKEPYTVAEKARELFGPEKGEVYLYSLLAQKQAGSINSSINAKLILPDNMSLAWSFPKNLNKTERGWRISEKLDTDKYWAAIITER